MDIMAAEYPNGFDSRRLSDAYARLDKRQRRELRRAEAEYMRVVAALKMRYDGLFRIAETRYGP